MTWRLEPKSAIARREAIRLLGVAAFGMAAPLHAAPVVRRPALRSDDDVARLLRLTNVPSLSLAQVDGDRITTKCWGVRRAGEGERVTPDTVYAGASLTKLVTSYIVLGLAQEGALSLDRPVQEYLPLPNPADPRAGAITARRLLSHSGGWRNWRNNNNQLLTADFEPGTRWSYSGEGFYFMQRVAEKLSNKGFGLLARERLFAPLGMTRSSLLGPEAFEPWQAIGHNSRGEPVAPFGRPMLLQLRQMMAERGLPLEAVRVEDAEQAIRAADPALPVLPNFMAPNSAASLLTSASDFARLLVHLVTARRQGGAAAAIVEQMMTPQIRCNEAVQWGLGVGLEEVGGRRNAWQWGDNPGYKNFFFADPVGGKAMVVFTNGDRGARAYERVIRAMTNEDHPGFLWA